MVAVTVVGFDVVVQVVSVIDDEVVDDVVVVDDVPDDVSIGLAAKKLNMNICMLFN